MYLTAEEKEIISRYRQLSESKKRAVLARESSFVNWINSALGWVSARIADFAASEIIKNLYNSFVSAFWGS